MASEKKSRPDWRTYLKPAERTEVDDLEARAKLIHDERVDISAKLLLIRNRALARRKLAENKHNAAVLAEANP